MATNRSYTVIGAFLLGALILLVIALLSFGGTRLLSDQRQAIIFFDQSVLGLTEGSRVMFRGVQIGTVKRVQLRLDPGHGRARIAVTIRISDTDVIMLDDSQETSQVETKDLVQRGLRAQLVVYSYVTSQLAVNLNFMPNTEPHFVADPETLDLPEIPSVPSEIEQLKDTVSDLPWRETLDSVNDTMQIMVKLARDLDETVNTLGPSLTQTSDTARKTLETVHESINSSSSRLNRTIASVNKLSENLNTQIESRDKQLDRILDNAEQTSAQLDQLAKNLRDLSDPGSDSRRDIDSAIRDLAASASSLRRFSERIERDPNALLFGGER